MGERLKLKEQERENMPAPCSRRLSSQPEMDWALAAGKRLLSLRADSRRRRAVPLAHVQYALQTEAQCGIFLQPGSLRGE